MADIAHDGHTRLVRPSDELLHLRLVLLQRYLDNLLTNKPFYTDPAFWLFVEAEDFAGMVREFGLAHQKIPDPPHPARITFNQPPDEVSPWPASLLIPSLAGQPLQVHCEHHQPSPAASTLHWRSFPYPTRHVLAPPSRLHPLCLELAQNIGALGKSLSGYLDATAGAEHHPRVIQLIDSLDTMERRLEEGVVHAKARASSHQPSITPKTPRASW